MSPTADLGVVSLIRAHILMGISHEIIVTVILLFTLIQEGLLSVTSESICTKSWLFAQSSVFLIKGWSGELTILT